MKRSTRRTLVGTAICLALAACGDGDGGVVASSGGGSVAIAPTTPVRVTVAGLVGLGLEVSLNGAAPVAPTGNGSFETAATVPAGASVSVAVTKQPVSPAQVCRASAPAQAADGTSTVRIDCDGPANGTAGSLEGTLAVKQLTLSWTATADATRYQVQRQVAGGAWVDDGEPISAPATSTVRALSLHLVDWATTRYRVAVCNARACIATTAELSVLDRIASAIGYLKASNTGAGDRFGAAIAMSADGTTLAVGAVEEDGNGTGTTGDPTNNAASNAGAVYVFVRGTDGWTQQAYVKALNSGASDAFGQALALSADGSTLAVGAPGEDSSTTTINSVANNSAADSGAAYVFVRTGVTWTQQAYVKASNAGANDAFGVSVSLSADGATLAVGAPGEDSSTTGVTATTTSSNNTATNAGAVYLFGRIGTGWSQLSYLKASVVDAGDNFGRSLALSGDASTLAVAAPSESSAATGVNGNATDNSSAAAGAVYVFARTPTSWSQQAYLKASNAGAEDQLGQSLAISGDGSTLAVGTPFEDSSAGAAVGDSVPESGAVYVFVRSGGDWSQQALLKAAGIGAGDFFGTSVAISADGGTLVVGAPLADGSVPGTGSQAARSVVDSGEVTTFVRNGPVWAVRSVVRAPFVVTSNQFGMNVALNGDGTLLAIGTPLEDSAATGYGGNAADASATDSGSVFVF
jgi:hypothetical protein